jgi:F-type H+-transporting ATPase subunit b
MRTRKLLVAALLAGAAIVVAAPAANAEDPGKKHGKELVECVEDSLADNKTSIDKKDYTAFETDLEDCKKAPSLIVPELSEIIWGGLAFLIVLVLLMKFGWPPIKQALRQRQEKIRNDLESAERARHEAEAEATQYRAQLGDARNEANRIVEEAREDAERVRRELVTKAEADAAEIRSRAQDDIRLAQERALSDLRVRVAEISVDLAEKVVERNLDRETQIALIDNYIDTVGNGTR